MPPHCQKPSKFGKVLPRPRSRRSNPCCLQHLLCNLQTLSSPSLFRSKLLHQRSALFSHRNYMIGLYLLQYKSHLLNSTKRNYFACKNGAINATNPFSMRSRRQMGTGILLKGSTFSLSTSLELPTRLVQSTGPMTSYPAMLSLHPMSIHAKTTENAPW